MVSLSEQIYGILKTISDAKQVSFFYPQSWTELPAVTFYEQQKFQSTLPVWGATFWQDCLL